MNRTACLACAVAVLAAPPAMAATCNGTSASETITCTTANDTGDAGAGNDTVNALGGNDVFHGGTGNDDLQGGNGDDELHGDADADNIEGSVGNDELHGGGGSDVLKGGFDADVLYDCCSTNTMQVDAATGGGDEAPDWVVLVANDNGARDWTNTVYGIMAPDDRLDITMGTEDSAELAAGFDSNDDGIITHQEGNSDLYAENVDGDLVLHFGEGGFGNTFTGSDRLILVGYGDGISVEVFDTYVP
jgi:hypothetical protein